MPFMPRRLPTAVGIPPELLPAPQAAHAPLPLSTPASTATPPGAKRLSTPTVSILNFRVDPGKVRDAMLGQALTPGAPDFLRQAIRHTVRAEE